MLSIQVRKTTSHFLTIKSLMQSIKAGESSNHYSIRTASLQTFKGKKKKALKGTRPLWQENKSFQLADDCVVSCPEIQQSRPRLKP